MFLLLKVIEITFLWFLYSFTLLHFLFILQEFLRFFRSKWPFYYLLDSIKASTNPALIVYCHLTGNLCCNYFILIKPLFCLKSHSLCVQIWIEIESELKVTVLINAWSVETTKTVFIFFKQAIVSQEHVVWSREKTKDCAVKNIVLRVLLPVVNIVYFYADTHSCEN